MMKHLESKYDEFHELKSRDHFEIKLEIKRWIPLSKLRVTQITSWLKVYAMFMYLYFYLKDVLIHDLKENWTSWILKPDNKNNLCNLGILIFLEYFLGQIPPWVL